MYLDKIRISPIDRTQGYLEQRTASRYGVSPAACKSHCFSVSAKLGGESGIDFAGWHYSTTSPAPLGPVNKSLNRFLCSIFELIDVRRAVLVKDIPPEQHAMTEVDLVEDWNGPNMTPNPRKTLLLLRKEHHPTQLSFYLVHCRCRAPSLITNVLPTSLRCSMSTTLHTPKALTACNRSISFFLAIIC